MKNLKEQPNQIHLLQNKEIILDLLSDDQQAGQEFLNFFMNAFFHNQLTESQVIEKKEDNPKKCFDLLIHSLDENNNVYESKIEYIDLVKSGPVITIVSYLKEENQEELVYRYVNTIYLKTKLECYEAHYIVKININLEKDLCHYYHFDTSLCWINSHFNTLLKKNIHPNDKDIICYLLYNGFDEDIEELATSYQRKQIHYMKQKYQKIINNQLVNYRDELLKNITKKGS